jgi:hypothetical protein
VNLPKLLARACASGSSLFVLESMTIVLTYVPQIETIVARSGIGELLSIVLWLSSNSDKRIAEKCSFLEPRTGLCKQQWEYQGSERTINGME